MRVVLSYATELDWHEGHQMARALGRLGHDVSVVNTDHPHARTYWGGTTCFPPDTTLDDVLGSAAVDLFFYIEPRGLLPRGLAGARCATACVLVDTALSLAPRQDLAQLFDHVLVLESGAMAAFPHHGQARTHWLPAAIDPAMFQDRQVPRDLDIAFVGRIDDLWADRLQPLDALSKRYRMNDVLARYPHADVPALYSRARIVFNLQPTPAINPRVFEAMACGALLLTSPRWKDLETLFRNGEHLVFFEGESDLIAKVDYYLAHDDERARIARAGHDEVHRHHTHGARLRRVLASITSQPFGTAPARRKRPSDIEDIYQRRHKQAGQVEALLRLAFQQPSYSVARYRTLARAGTTLVRRVGGAWRD